MKIFVSTTLLALALATPAFAQQAPGQDATQATVNGYLQQAARLEAEEQALPAGGDHREQDKLEWRALVARANADRIAHQSADADSSRPAGTLR
jgi:hypothetical protein